MGDRTPPPWRLSAAESFVLLNGPGANASEALKLGLMELVATGALILGQAEQRVLFVTSHVAALREGPRGSEIRARPLARLYKVYTQTPKRLVLDGAPAVAAAQLARAVVTTLGSVNNYVTQVVLPSLAERGLYAAQPHKVLGIFSTTSWRRTPAGDNARGELSRWLADGEQQFGDWAQHDPPRAAVYVAGAGAALLLMPALFPDLRRLSVPSDSGDVNGGWFAAAVVADASAGTPVDFSGFDFSTFDLSSFDAAAGAIDAAVDASSDSGSGSDSGSDSSSDSSGSSDSS